MKIIQENILKTRVMDLNAMAFNVSIKKWMEIAGLGIAKEIEGLINKSAPRLRPSGSARDKKKLIAFFCGTGNNGGDGFAAAKHLFKKYHCKILLFGDPKKIKTPESKFNWQRIKKLGIPYVVIKSPKNIPSLPPLTLRGGKKQSPLRIREGKGVVENLILVDCLVGTGIKGKLKEPIASAVKLFNKTKAKKVAVDFPTFGIKNLDITVSMQFPKTANAKTVTLSTNKKFLSTIGPGEVKSLNLPKPNSHKRQNGKLLVIAGSEKYHGALIYAIKTASKIVDLIYVSSPKNKKLVQKLKSKSASFITLRGSPLPAKVPVDCVLVGPGLDTSIQARKVVTQVLKSQLKAVIDADGLNVMDTKMLGLINHRHILTPHKREFQKLFNLSPTPTNAEKMSKKYKCTIALKGKVDVVANPNWGLKYNYTGNAGLTKGGTGDVLAGLIAGLYCTNDAYLAAAAGIYLNGKAGDFLYKKQGTFYNAEDLINQIPLTFNRLVKSH